MAWRLEVALTFGVSIAVLVYSTAHTSGGQINSAVTLALVVSGQLKWVQGLANVAAQFLGAVVGAGLVEAALPVQTSLGSNTVSADYTLGEAFICELLFTLLLCVVVFQTAVDGSSVAKNMAPLAIGLAVFLAHVALLPVTGCSINPPRSFGPALVATIAGEKDLFNDYWVFFVAPHLAGVLAALGHHLNNLPTDKVELDEANEPKDEELEMEKSAEV